MVDDRAFADLQKVRAHLASAVAVATIADVAIPGGRQPALPSGVIAALGRLGAVAVPLLVRELDGARRTAAGRCLLEVARHARARVVSELQALAERGGDDELTICVLGLLSELGERGASARFSDPHEVSRRSAQALVNQLDGAARIAQAAAIMVETLSEADLLGMAESIADADPARGHALFTELSARLDLPTALRETFAARAAERPVDDALDLLGEAPQGTRAVVLVDGAARAVVVATSATGNPRRRFAVLVDETGCIEECLVDHVDAAPAQPVAAPVPDRRRPGQMLLPLERAPMLAPSDDPMLAALLADGYQVTSRDASRAATVVATAARRTVERGGALPPAYYLGRDLLGLCHEHTGADTTPYQRLCARALDLLATGDATRALPLLERCAALQPDDAEIASSLGLCLMTVGRIADAQRHLSRAVALEPGWPLHHWNLAAAAHADRQLPLAARALGEFVRTSARNRLLADREQQARLGVARAFLDDYRRAGRLDRNRRAARRSAPAAATSRRAARADRSPSAE